MDVDTYMYLRISSFYSSWELRLLIALSAPVRPLLLAVEQVHLEGFHVVSSVYLLI